MIFHNTPLEGVYVIEFEPLCDGRGFFTRTFCMREFEAHGLRSAIAQCNISCNPKAGTLRGMHFQLAPTHEAKIVQCVSGGIFDVALDLRPKSATHKQWFALELSGEGRRMLYIPEGCAHGFQTLVHDSTIFYYMMDYYSPTHYRGVRWDDPSFGIQWPQPPAQRVISLRDASWPDYTL